MADTTKRARKDDDNVSAKAQELLARYPSTVFAFDTSGDSRYIKCDFPQCKQHAEALQGKRCWLLNTLKNVKVLEKHVGKEVHHYMKEIDSGTDDQLASAHYVESEDYLETQSLPEGTKKVLAVFNLKDPQSQFGDWISLFLKAAFMAEENQQNDCVVITQNFVSRQELMECIAKLNFLNSHWPTVEVVTVLSCHSSCQGQVFACTPFAIGKQCGFEEFCSLHDFVMACQTVLKDTLKATHISSCFTLKLDCSHADWPVDADWLKTKLHCILCGSTKEVYETGSQVADLHLMLSTMIHSVTSGTCGTRLKDAVSRACSEGFPDLAREMGLGFLGSDNLEQRLLTEGKEDQVTPPGLVMSSMRVVFLVQDEFPETPSQESDISRHSGSYIALADAIVANLKIRKASDVKFEYMAIRIQHSKASLLQESLKKHLESLPCDTYKVLFIALGPMFASSNVELVNLIKKWNDLRAGDVCYGIHFQHVTAMQAYVIKNRLKEFQNSDDSENGAEKTSSGGHLAVTGLVENENRNCSAAFPVLLYMIHLAVGENGNRLAGKGIPSAVYSKKPVSHGVSSWTLEEVYMETCHVLSGLSRKCGLHLLSPATNPVGSTSTTGAQPKALHTPSSERNTLEECVLEKHTHAGPSSCDVQPTALSEEDAPSTVALVTKICTATEDRNAAKSLHKGIGDICAFNDKRISGNKIPMQHPSQPQSNAVMMDAGFSEKNCSNGLSNAGFGPFKGSEQPSGVLCNESPFSTIPAGDVFTPLGKKCDDEDGLAEGSDCGRCYKKLSLNVAPHGEDASLSQKEGSNVEVVDDEDPLEEAVDDEDPLEEAAVDEVCYVKPSLTITSVEGATLSVEVGNALNLVLDVDGSYEELGHAISQNNFSSYTKEIVTNASRPVGEANVMKLMYDKDTIDGEADYVVRHEEQCSTVGQAITDAPSTPEKKKKRKKKKFKEKGKKIENTGLGNSEAANASVKNKPFQKWLQNFTEFCKEQNESDQKKVEANNSVFEDWTFQDTPVKCRKEKSPSKRISKNCMPESLEINDTSAEIQSVEQTSGAASTNDLEFVCEDATSGQISSADHEQVQIEPDSVNSKETASYNYRNVFEIMEAKEAESTADSEFDTRENNDMQIDCEDACTKKRSLSNDISDDVEQTSAKKLKNESYSECKNRTEGTFDTNWDKSDDLPLMANVDEVIVHHYILDLAVKFDEKSMKGNIVLFLEPRNDEVTKKQFQMTLDSTLVNIESVSEVILPDDFKVTFSGQRQDSLSQEVSTSGVHNGFLGNILGDKTQTPLPFKGLSYSVYGWCVQIWKPEATGKAWPRCVWIKYHTSPEGSSLTWATDQDGKPSVFSPGAYINNRSLMPCQEPPVAMSTWQASIHVPEGCAVLMSGNQFVGKTTGSDDQVTYHYEMDCPLPCSTLALAVGWWQCRLSRDAETKNGSGPDVPVTCRLFAPPSLIDSAADELLGYAPKFLEASCELLGPYPFRRLDMLVLPKCFACMGLKSPNLVFLSQSLLSGDASMRVRLAHEISHAWFGLLVGAKDWSEEWLSEGFATFIEEKIQSKAEKWSKDKDRFYREMRQILRHRCLLSEIQECDDSLKCLRPKVVKPKSALSTAEAVQRSSGQTESIRPHTVVQFGQICSRKWTQVHYLKGYFLLHRMASMVGLEEFDEFLFNYVQHFKGQLVSSEDFFEFFVQSFSNIPREVNDKLVHEWLESAGLPKSFPKKFESPDNELVSKVQDEFQTWKKQDMINKRNKTLKVRKRKQPPTSTLEVADQVVLLLEKLLERENISHSTLRQLGKCYNLSGGNAEIRHRWCELVVKHNYNPGLPDVQRFLVEDQGMGIYLFGELIISQQPKQRALVDEVLKEIGPEMDRCTYQTVKDMIEGND